MSKTNLQIHTAALYKLATRVPVHKSILEIVMKTIGWITNLEGKERLLRKLAALKEDLGSIREKAVELAGLVNDLFSYICNAQSRHDHQAHCDGNCKKREIERAKFERREPGAKDPSTIPVDCRFDFPFEIQSKSRVVVEQKKNKSGNLTTRIRIVSKRNDKWINSHMRSVMEIWGANMDWQLVLDLGLVLNYMTKYVTKSDMANNRAVHQLVKSVYRDTVTRQG